MLDQYRRDFAEFNVACAREHYLFQSGQKNTLEIAPIYERYGHLFDRDLVDGLKRELLESSADFETEGMSKRRLFAFAVEQFLEDSVKRLTEEIGEYEAAATVEWMGREMTFQDCTVAITTERHRESRRALYRRRLAVIEASNNLRADRLLKLHETARDLEYSSYVELLMRDLAFGVDYAELSDAMCLLHLTIFDDRFLLVLIDKVYTETMAGLG